MLTTEIIKKTVKRTRIINITFRRLKKKRFDKQNSLSHERTCKFLELILFTKKLNSKFFIRLTKNRFQKKTEKKNKRKR